MLFEKVKAIIENNCGIDSSARLIVGVSGGADSSALLDILSRLDFQLIAAHMNHQLRPSADEEMEFVKRLAAHYGIEFISRREDVSAIARKQKLTTEEAARNARYKFLFETAREHQAAAVAVAHHADDQVETILMNLLRGSGLTGLTGMDYRSEDLFQKGVPLIRPLLDSWREEIITYCRNNQLDYVNDESNQDVSYTRNRIRLQLVPELEKYNPNIKKSLIRMADVLRLDKQFIQESLVENWQPFILKADLKWVEINLACFMYAHASIQNHFIRWILKEYFPDQRDIGSIQIETARNVLAEQTNSSSALLNDQVIVLVEDNRGIITTQVRYALPSDEWPCIDQNLEIPITPGEYAVSKSWKLQVNLKPRNSLGNEYLKNKDSLNAYLDADQTTGKFMIRTWQAGDRFQPMGMAGKTIKMSDFWIDRKVPERAKKYWPLILCSDKIVWIPGFQPSHEAMVTDKTKNVLLLKLLKI
jgi:tRNA(Ile)-lysidine synthase